MHFCEVFMQYLFVLVYKSTFLCSVYLLTRFFFIRDTCMCFKNIWVYIFVEGVCVCAVAACASVIRVRTAQTVLQENRVPKELPVPPDCRDPLATVVRL